MSEGPLFEAAAIATRMAEFALDKKALDVVILDMSGLVDYADFIVICSGRSDRQTRAILDAVEAGLRAEFALRPIRVEGLPQAHWILCDYGDAILHVFTPDARSFYRLEDLWRDAPARAIGSARRLEG